MLKRASELLEVKENTLKEFEETDSINSGNILKGVICRQSDHRYGALVLFAVNDKPCEQVIYCTPKLEYPFNRNGDFLWPDVDQLEVWDKLDGTNILAYWYDDCVDGVCCTFKTRLTPILSDGKYGGFKSMWMSYLEDNSWIWDVILMNNAYNLSFEMYGSRNPITVEYSIPLDVNLLFGIRRTDHAVKPLSQLVLPEKVKLPKSIQIEQKHDLTALYEKLRSEMSEQNEEDVFFIEGAVLYAHCGQPSWRQFKAKPDEIQKIHWANGGISRRELWNTAVNSFEEGESTVEHFIELLKEEYTDQQIGRSEIRVRKIFIQAKSHVHVIANVNRVWEEAKKKGFDVTKDKAQTFRFMGQFFDKREMKKVGTIILRQVGLVKEKGRMGISCR